MLSSPRNNLVVSDQGFSVEVLGRVGIQYKEDDGLCLFVDGEMLAGPSGFVIYSNRMRPEEGSIPIDLTETKKKQIIANIREAFKFWGFDIQVF